MHSHCNGYITYDGTELMYIKIIMIILFRKKINLIVLKKVVEEIVSLANLFWIREPKIDSLFHKIINLSLLKAVKILYLIHECMTENDKTGENIAEGTKI